MEINDYLKGLDEQEVQEESEILVVSNPVVEELCEKYKEILKNLSESGVTVFESSKKSIREFNYSANDVRDFSIILKNYEEDDGFFNFSGFFLSALINVSKEDNLEIVTAHLKKNVPGIGFRNEKNLKIIGNAGHDLGYGQKSGQIILKGNADDFAGNKLSGGVIRITGNTGGALGYNAENGEIYVNGNIRIIDTECKAKVYHKGELIWPK